MKLKSSYTFILLFFITLNFSQATVRNLTTAITSSQIDVSIQTATAQAGKEKPDSQTLMQTRMFLRQEIVMGIKERQRFLLVLNYN